MLKITILLFMYTAFVYALDEDEPQQVDHAICSYHVIYNALCYDGSHAIPLKRNGVAYAPETSPVINEIMSTVVTMASNMGTDIVVFAIKNAVAVLLSAMLTLAVCHFTSICRDINQITPFRQLDLAMKYFATPEMLSIISDFVHDAIEKYSNMQE